MFLLLLRFVRILITDETCQPVMPVQMKAVHEKDKESGSDISVVKETEEVEERKDGQIEGRQKTLQIIIELKK